MTNCILIWIFFLLVLYYAQSIEQYNSGLKLNPNSVRLWDGWRLLLWCETCCVCVREVVFIYLHNVEKEVEVNQCWLATSLPMLFRFTQIHDLDNFVWMFPCSLTSKQDLYLCHYLVAKSVPWSATEMHWCSLKSHLSLRSFGDFIAYLLQRVVFCLPNFSFIYTCCR